MGSLAVQLITELVNERNGTQVVVVVNGAFWQNRKLQLFYADILAIAVAHGISSRYITSPDSIEELTEKYFMSPIKNIKRVLHNIAGFVIVVIKNIVRCLWSQWLIQSVTLLESLFHVQLCIVQETYVNLEEPKIIIFARGLKFVPIWTNRRGYMTGSMMNAYKHRVNGAIDIIGMYM